MLHIKLPKHSENTKNKREKLAQLEETKPSTKIKKSDNKKQTNIGNEKHVSKKKNSNSTMKTPLENITLTQMTHNLL